VAELTPEEITPDEWRRRYAARLMDRGGMPERAAIECARETWQMVRDDLEADGSFIGPEDAADMEMAEWEDDGEELHGN
jgi:hypothetical protein